MSRVIRELLGAISHLSALELAVTRLRWSALDDPPLGERLERLARDLRQRRDGLARRCIDLGAETWPSSQVAGHVADHLRRASASLSACGRRLAQLDPTSSQLLSEITAGLDDGAHKLSG